MRDVTPAIARPGNDPVPAHKPSHDDWYRDVPRSIRGHAVFGLSLMVLTFGGFGAWAFGAPLAAAVIAHGSFVATGENKVVQHLEGGIIEAILVEEGQFVRQGQTLVRLDRTTPLANERELEIRGRRLEATEARLLAEYAEVEDLIFSEALEAARSDPEIDAILAGQVSAFNISRRALDQDVALLEVSAEALEVRKNGYITQLAAHHRQLAILNEELEAKNGLLQTGLTRKPEVLAVRRAIAEAEGQIGRLEAEIAEISETQRRHLGQIERAKNNYREAALDELQAVQAELESVREQARKARDVLDRADVEAPVSGRIIRLHYHTSGGVIESGKPIVEILPEDAPLIIETQILRTDIDVVRVGEPASVRLTALNQRTTPVIEGEVIYISADAVAQQREDGPRDVYLVRVSLSPGELDRVKGFVPTPGMPAEIMIQTEERTFAQYLAKPILDSMNRAFREQ